MIDKLRKKFILAAMLSTFLVLFLIIGTINIANFVSVNRGLNNRLELISENGGSFPDLMNTHPPKEDIQPEKKDDFFDKPGINKESQFATRYFTVIINEDGTVNEINTGKVSAVTVSQAGDYAVELLQKNKIIGFVEDYKYLRTTLGDENYMYVFINCQMEIETVKSFLFASVGISIIGLIGVFILVWFFSGKIMRPVAESYEKQKQFVTDASHEIKTPLTIIDANTEVLEMTTGENEWTKSIRKQIGRLTSLTEQLVFLSKMDEESSTIEMSDFSLSDAVFDMAEIFKTLAVQKNKTLEIDIEEAINYNGDEKSIRQLISILLDNAIKYSDADGAIRIKLNKTGKNNRIKVWNTVANISTGKHDELFERFLRLDKSRNSKSGGFGIGLSVAYAIVNAHKGKITAESHDGKSIVFTIIL